MATRSAKSASADVGVEDDVRADDIRAGTNGSNSEEAIDEVSERLEALERQLRDAGDRLLESAKSLTDAASKQMQLHPMAAFGVAFLAGITVARLLRR